MRPHRRQPARLSCPWDSPGKTLEWAAISFSNAWKWKVKVKSLSRVRPSATPWTAAFQAPPSMGFSRQEYWSGVPLPPPVYTIYLPTFTYSHIQPVVADFKAKVIFKKMLGKQRDGTKVKLVSPHHSQQINWVLALLSNWWDFPGGSVNNPPAKNSCRRRRDCCLGREHPPEEGMATHSSILAWEIPWTEEPGRLWCRGSPKSWTQLRG